ncbi:MAG: hypothetical protein QM754_18140 [Tepidisphaeraceae bacterium]
MITADEFARMAFFIRRHDYRFKLDKLCRAVHVAIDELDTTTGLWEPVWHVAKSLRQLREVLGY